MAKILSLVLLNVIYQPEILSITRTFFNREILHQWVYEEKLLHKCLRIQGWAELRFKRYRISGS